MIDEAIPEAVILDMLDCFRANNENHSGTRDVFAARLQSYILETKKYLEAVIINSLEKALTPLLLVKALTACQNIPEMFLKNSTMVLMCTCLV